MCRKFLINIIYNKKFNNKHVFINDENDLIIKTKKFLCNDFRFGRRSKILNNAFPGIVYTTFTKKNIQHILLGYKRSKLTTCNKIFKFYTMRFSQN